MKLALAVGVDSALYISNRSFSAPIGTVIRIEP